MTHPLLTSLKAEEAIYFRVWSLKERNIEVVQNRNSLFYVYAVIAYFQPF